MAERTLEYDKLVSTYFMMWRKYLPSNARENYPELLSFAQFLSVTPSAQLSFKDVVYYVEALCSKITPLQANEVLDMFEQYFDFLINMGYCPSNPFRPSMCMAQPNLIDSKPEQLTPFIPDSSVLPTIPLPDPVELEESPETDEVQIVPPQAETYSNHPPVQSPPPKDTPLPEVIKRFCYVRRHEGRRLDESSIASYKTDFNAYQDFLKNRHLDFSLESLRAFVRYLNLCEKNSKPKKGSYLFYLKNLKKTKARQTLCFAAPRAFSKLHHKFLEKSTISHRKNALRSLLQFACDEDENLLPSFGHKWSKILVTARRDKAATNPHQALSLEESTQLVKYSGQSQTITLRDKLELLIPLGSGTRPEETVVLKVCNIDFTTLSLKLTETKNHRPRTSPLPKWIVPLLKDYIKEEDLGNDSFLFPTRQSPHMSTKALNKHLQALLKAAGIHRKFTAHDLRATCTTYHLFYGRENEKNVMKMMGHADINTTYGYCANWHRDENTPTLKAIYAYWENLLYPNGFPQESVFGIPLSDSKIYHLSCPSKSDKIIPFIPSFKAKDCPV